MGDTYTTALSGIKAAKAEMALNSHNIANANTEGYTRLLVNKNSSITGNKVNGVDISGITTYIDQNLQDRVYDRISTHEYNDAISSTLNELHSEFGTPNSGTSIDSYINKFFNSLELLASAPNSASLKLNAYQDAESVATKISGLAQKIEKLRYHIDGELKHSIDSLNTQLQNAHDLSLSLNTFVEGSLEQVTTQDRLLKTFEKISTYLSINKFNDQNGKTKVFTLDGTSIVGESQYFLKYVPITSETPLITNESLNPILVSYYDAQGVDANFNREIVSAGKSSEITHNLGKGKLSGLLYLRDKELPNILAQLDRIAKNFSDEFNRIHNEGVGYNPPSELRGNSLVSRNQYLGFSGNVRISMVDTAGKPVASLPSVTIDLAKLDSGNGAGKANVESLLQEIDYQFGAKLSTEKSAAVGNLKDIKLTAVSSEVTPGAPLELDLELYNFSQTNATVTILGATATDGTSANILNSFSGTSHVIANGKYERTGMTGPSITLTNLGTISYPYTLDVDVRVNDGTSNYDATISYVISSPTNNPINGIKNQRFSAVAVTGAATLNNPSHPGGIVKTTLIDQDGYDIAANSDTPGIVRIATLDDSYRIVIDNLDSNHIGVVGSTDLATNEKLSFFLGLNDFFVRTDKAENWGSIKNAAYYLKIRNDIKNNPNLMATGVVKTIIDYASPTTNTYTYEVREGDIENLNKLIDLSKKKIFFAQAGNLTGTTITINEYATEILANNTTQLRRYQIITDESKAVRTALQDKIQNIKGVDINEELANMILYQQAFTASAKLINTVKEMDQILLDLM